MNSFNPINSFNIIFQSFQWEIPQFENLKLRFASSITDLKNSFLKFSLKFLLQREMAHIFFINIGTNGSCQRFRRPCFNRIWYRRIIQKYGWNVWNDRNWWPGKGSQNQSVFCHLDTRSPLIPEKTETKIENIKSETIFVVSNDGVPAAIEKWGRLMQIFGNLGNTDCPCTVCSNKRPNNINSMAYNKYIGPGLD